MITSNDQDFCKTIWSFRLNGKKYRKRLRMKIETNLFKRVTVVWNAIAASCYYISFDLAQKASDYVKYKRCNAIVM
jgi:hypothetical protein